MLKMKLNKTEFTMTGHSHSAEISKQNHRGKEGANAPSTKESRECCQWVTLGSHFSEDH